MHWFRLVAAAAALLTSPALANDSEAEWAVGGLVLKANADISMDKEDLYLSAEEVRVDYVYTNHSSEDRDVVISFPLPALPLEDGWYDYNYPDWDWLAFETRVDGEKVGYEVHDRAIIGARDVTALLKAEGLPLDWHREGSPAQLVEGMDGTRREHLVKLGLLRQAENWLEPAWQVQRHYLRVQTFPAGKSVRVSHRYKPLTGGSVGGALMPEVRNNPEWSPLPEYRQRFCVDDSILAGLDRRMKPSKPGHMVYYSELWLGYVLSSGANWRGPIKDFRLVVDKGSTDNLVSFCMDGVTKIGPTQFEVRRTDFEPEGDLDILILQFTEVED